MPPVADNAVLEPLQIVTFCPAFAFTFTTLTVTVPEAEQPLELVTVAIYVVVAVGDATTLCVLVLFNPVEGLQLNVEPELPAFKVVLLPEQTFTLFPKFTVGELFTATVTDEVALQPLLEAVTVYVVVVVGEAIGY